MDYYLKLFNSEETQLLKMKEDKLYCGNIDQLITCSSDYQGRKALTQVDQDTIGWSNGLQKLSGYPLMLGCNGTIGDSTRFQGDAHREFKYFGLKDETHSYFKCILRKLSVEAEGI